MNVYLHLPSGSSALAPGVSYPLSNPGSKTFAADIDGDGRPDIVTVSLDGNSISMLLNQSANPGTFLSMPTIATGKGLGDVVAADINGNGRIDLIEADGDGNEPDIDGLSIHPQPGTFGTFQDLK